MHALIIRLWPRFEHALEVAQTHLTAGDRVTFLGCDGEMTACWANPEHIRSFRSKCQGQSKHGLSLLQPRITARSFLNLTHADEAELRGLRTTFDNLDDLRNYRLEQFDIGMAIASGLISAARDTSLDLTKYETIV